MLKNNVSMNTVTITIEEYDQLREVKKAFEAKFGYLDGDGLKFVSLNRDEYIEELKLECEAQVNQARIEEVERAMKYRDKYIAELDDNVDLTRKLEEEKSFHRSVYRAIALTAILLLFIFLHQNNFSS
jgi:hypothetical protein